MLIAMAGCTSCGSASRVVHPNLPMSEQPKLTASGVYDLITAKSTRPYVGRHNHRTVSIVGYRTKYERVFKVTEGKQAAAYAKTADPTGTLRVIRTTAHRLPADIGLALFGE